MTIYDHWLYRFLTGPLNNVAWLYILLPCVFAGGRQTKEGLKDGDHYQVDFSKFTFNAPGTYTFALNEQIPNSGLGKWKYDQHVYTVTVTVTDEGGKLVARADGTTGASGFVFTNSYETSTSYELQGGLEIAKTLKGKDLHAGMAS